MDRITKGLVRNALARFDIGITRLSRLQQLAGRGRDMELLLQMPTERGARAFQLLNYSRSQLRQDIFALSWLNFKRGGFFVEFGATDGVYLSNTHLMEKEFGWRGILAEPARRWQTELQRNRSCFIETDCVWRDTGSILMFCEKEEGAFSTVDSFKGSNLFRKNAIASKYEVKTISLSELLAKYDAPQRIDYLSVDTEGSEFDILSSFDFSKRQFGVITVEHGFRPDREKIYTLLTKSGYVRKLETLSLWDDWYVLP